MKKKKRKKKILLFQLIMFWEEVDKWKTDKF